MKRIYTVILTALCLAGCDTDTEFWSEASYATIDAITGRYTLYSGIWSSEIDLSGNGLVTDDLLYQMELYGWTGIVTIQGKEDPEPLNALHQSLVMHPYSPEVLAQINLYVPYPEYGKDQTEETIKESGQCNIHLDSFKCHYKVNSKGEIEVFNLYDRQMTGHGGTLKNINIRFEGEYIHLEAETSLFDWSTSSWQDGTMNLTYRHN